MARNATTIIKEANRSRVDAWLRGARPRAHARTLDYADLAPLTVELERRLDPLPVAARPGATATVRTGEVVSWHYSRSTSCGARAAGPW